MSAVIDRVKQSVSGLRERGVGEMRSPSSVNVNNLERAVSMMVGGVLLAQGLKRRSLGGAVLALAGGGLVSRGVTGHSTVYQKLNLHTTGGRAFPTTERNEADVTRAITIGKPADELYRLWRDPQVFPRIMEHFADVNVTDETHAHWAVHGPMGRPIEWDTEIVEDRPGELIRWRARTGTELPNDGSLQFRPAPGGRGTEVLLRFHFSPPGGAAGKTALKLLGFIPKLVAYKALWRLKTLAETGDIPSIKCQPAGRNDGRDR